MSVDCKELLLNILSIGTSNQWSLLAPVVTKLNNKFLDRKLGPISEQDFLTLLEQTDENLLKHHGIFLHRLSKTCTIININRAYGYQRQKEIQASGKISVKCSCAMLIRDENYFGSHNYNGGRHACTASLHRGSCPLWLPPSSGHLHSWRRGHSI